MPSMWLVSTAPGGMNRFGSRALRPRAVDLHAHFLPGQYRRSALAHGAAHPDGMPYLPEWNAADAVTMTDEVGIAAAALSLFAPGMSFLADLGEQAALVRAVCHSAL